VEKEIRIDLHLDEDDTTTVATAVLDLRGDHFEARGMARRNPVDAPMPIIGEELAIARALQALTAELMDGAHTRIDEFLSA
jgi:hypothetical protein